MYRLIGVGVVGVSLGACVNARNVPAYPLFKTDDPADEVVVATLVGDVESVDGKSVSSHGHRFALLPGCHTVTNVTNWGGMDTNAGIRAHLPEVPFALDMKGGLTYVVRISIVGPVGEGGRVQITAVEQDSSGTVLRKFKPGPGC